MEVEEEMESTAMETVSANQMSHILRRKSVMGKDALSFGKEQHEEETMDSL